MKGLLEFIKQFLSNQGMFVFMANIISKLSMLFVAIIAARLLSEENYGLIVLISSVFAIFTPLIGMGSNQGLLRFGVLEEDLKSKEELSHYVFWKGFLNHGFITLLYLIVCIFYAINYDGLLLIIFFFTIRLIGYYFFNHGQTYYRMIGDNMTYSLMNMTVSLSGIFMVAILTYFFGIVGYLISMALMPWISLFFHREYKRLKNYSKPNLDFKKFWNYSIHASITYFFSEMLFSLDFLMIGILLDESSVAFYKVAIILPMNLSFLPLTFMQTDYPKIAQKYSDRAYLLFYIKNYYKIFIPLGMLILLVGYLVKDFIIPFVFGAKYAEGDGWVFFIILCTLVGNMWMRNLYGNMISAVGKAHWNTYTTIGSLVIMLLLGLLLIPKYGIMGAAIGISMALTFTGIAGMLLFHNYLRKLKTIVDAEHKKVKDNF